MSKRTINTMQEFQAVYGFQPPGFIAMQKFCDAVDSGQPVDPEFLKTCSKGFRKILAEDKLQDGLMFFAKAMGLNKKHTNKRTAADADVELALVMEVLLLEQSGIKPGQAKKKIAQQSGWGLTTIQSYYRKHESDARWFMDNFKF